MGFYVRKSVRAGPFRFNLSKTGLGVSAGVPGFRVGTGPRGNYIRAGRHGVYYRASLGSSASGRHLPAHVPAGGYHLPQPSGEVLLEDVTGASAAHLAPTGPGDLVAQLNTAVRRIPLAPFLIVALAAAIAAQRIVGLALLVPGVPAAVWLALRDRSRRTVVAFFDVNDDVAAWFENVVQAFQGLKSTSATWRIARAGRVASTHQWKVNAGASTILSRTRALVSMSGPRVLATNIAVPTIAVGTQALHFLPDRLLVRDGRRFSDVSYATLRVSATATRFIEDGHVPRDSQQVDTTWRFVNKNGSPDRRFNNNKQLPVMLYGELDIGSPTGLHWAIQTSQPTAADRAATAVSAAPTVLTKIIAEVPASPTSTADEPNGTKSAEQGPNARPSETPMSTPAADATCTKCGHQNSGCPRRCSKCGTDL